jgi:site-specific DNA recombinase
LEVDATEAAIVREVAGWYLSESIGFKTIAKRMRDRGIASRRGKGWSFTSVRSLLANPILVGRIRFNVRKMQLDRRSGRRVPRPRATDEQLERQDETLRILDDATFEEIQRQLAKASRGKSSRKGGGIAPFTGLVYCACGSKCYRVTSENAKGKYYYYVCGRHLNRGDCPHSARIREDALVSFVKSGFEHVLNRADEIVSQACKLAAKMVASNRGEADRIKGEIASLDKDLSRLGALLVDADIAAEPAAKKALVRQLADVEHKRDGLLSALDNLRDDANENTEGLAATIRELLEVVRENLGGAATPEQFNRFAELLVGPVEIAGGREGHTTSISQKKLPAAEATGNPSNHLSRPIAGGGFEPPTSGL